MHAEKTDFLIVNNKNCYCVNILLHMDTTAAEQIVNALRTVLMCPKRYEHEHDLFFVLIIFMLISK